MSDLTGLTTAVVLARGLGSRMRRDDSGALLSTAQAAAADHGAKAMMPMVGRPFLDHVLTALADGGITDVCLVIGPDHGSVRDYYRGLTPDRLTVHFAVQQEALGTADAVLAAEDWTGQRRFLVVNGDNHYEADVVRALAAVPGNALAGYDRTALVERSNIDAGRLSAFALVSASAGELVEIIEKPDADVVEAFGEHAMLSMNCFAFTPRIYEACAAIGPSTRGEYEIVDAVRWLVEQGESVRVVPVESGVLDLSRRADVSGVDELLRGSLVRL